MGEHSDGDRQTPNSQATALAHLGLVKLPVRLAADHPTASSLYLTRKPPFATDCAWPGPGFPWGRRKLTLPGQAIEPKVSSLARPRIHSDGQLLSFASTS